MKRIEFYKDFDNRIDNVVEGVELNLEFDVNCINEEQARRICEFVEHVIMTKIVSGGAEVKDNKEEY